MAQDASSASSLTSIRSGTAEQPDGVSTAHQKSYRLLVEIEQHLGLPAGTFLATRTEVETLPERVRQAEEFVELLTLFYNLGDEDRRKFLELLRSLARRG